MITDTNPSRASRLAFALLILGTTLGIAGIDLVLPAVPELPEILNGTQAMAQLVLASYVGGTCLGLILFGELGARIDQRKLLIASLLIYAAVSVACALAPNLPALVALRFVQGLSGAAAAVFAPGIIRVMFSAHGAVRALGLMGSVESLVPALAPIFGLWLLLAFGWQSSFYLIGILSILVAGLIARQQHRIPLPPSTRGEGNYLHHLRNPVYLRYALSQAFTLGGLLIFVFGAPAMITKGLGGELGDFIVMQVTGIVLFIAASNAAGHLVKRFGAETMILAGSVISAGGVTGILVYGLTGGTHPLVLAALFIPVNLGLGLRGPPGFYRAILAAQGDDARAAALLLVAMLLTTAVGTAVAAPFVTLGIAPLAGVAAMISCASVACLLALPKLQEPTP
ncbi:MFS transporter [Hyphomonas sp. WL0036]|uniref:MFS transporter n=1 Tax=Hyphomonas sediminis TaxID=2866160 RepID=UPI001C81D7EC|nr:MFS transporter [Hyphomonas sediminis]MBY9067663.1 MFS transporter [Hyphomonas sediminis]